MKPRGLPAPKTRDLALVLARGALGDVLIGLPLLAVLPKYLKVEGLTLVGHPAIMDLLANQPFVSNIDNHDRADWAGLYQHPPTLTDRLKKIILNHQVALVMARNSDDQAARGLKSLGLSVTIVSSRPDDRPVHLVDQMARALGVSLPDQPVLIQPRDKTLSWGTDFIKKFNLRPGQWAAIHPGSGGRHKNWPAKKWIELSKFIKEKLGWPTMFFLGPAEENFNFKDSHFSDHDLSSRSVRGLTLPQLTEALALSGVYVGNDSGVSHLAAALGLPALAIFGPTNPLHWRPQGPRSAYLHKITPHHPYFTWPDPEEVYGKIMALLSV